MRLPYDQLTDEQIKYADLIVAVDPQTGATTPVPNDQSRSWPHAAAPNGAQIVEVLLANDDARYRELSDRVAAIKRTQLDTSASELAQKHFQVEPGLTRVVQFSATVTLAPAEPIKLLEVNTNSPSVGVMPLGFGPAPGAGIMFPSVIIEVTPEEFDKIEKKELHLPKGWEYKRREIPRPPETAEGQ
jgi:hypothetical protein